MRKSILFLLGLITCLVGRAQITIAPSDYLSPLDDTVMTKGVFFISLQGEYFGPPAAGSGQTWDFRWLELTSLSMDPELSETPANFAGGNNIDMVPVRSAFNPGLAAMAMQVETLSDDGKILLGEEIETAQVVTLGCASCTDADSMRFEPVVNTYQAPDTLIFFPLNEGDTWSSSYTRQYDLTLFLPSFGQAGVAAQQTDSITVSYHVIGSGNVILPNLTVSGLQDINVLLLERAVTVRSFYTVDGQPAPPALLDTLGTAEGDTLTLTTYEFWTQGLDRPTLRIDFDPANVFGLPVYTVAGMNSEINPAAEGEVVAKTTMVDTIDRQYYVYVPPTYDGTEPIPVVFCFHGFSSNAIQHMWTSQFNVVADTGHFLVVYPQGELATNVTSLPAGLPSESFGFNVGQIIVSDNDELAFFDTMLDELKEDFNLDSTRVYSSGYSNGGWMTCYLACNRPEQIAAIAPLAGIIDCGRTEVIPTAIFHGNDDAVVAYPGDPLLESPPVFPLTVEFAELNGCDAAPDSVDLPNTIVEDSTSVTQFTFNNCDPAGEVIHYRTNGGAHWWDGGPPIPPFYAPIANPHTSRDFSASEAMWAFFQRHSKQAATDIARPQAVFAYQLFPNPSQQQLTLSLDLPRRGPVRATLFSPLGQPVATIVDDVLSAGKHQFVLPHRNLPAGLYQCRIEVAGQVQTQSVLLR